MKILVTGADGYEGWPLVLHLKAEGHDVRGIDNEARRGWVSETSGQSVQPIADFGERKVFAEGCGVEMVHGLISTCIANEVRGFHPDAVVHLAEQPSAPYSMISKDFADYTLSNNISTTNALLWAMREHAPDAHLIYVSTMGEYGTPGVPIPEGVFPADSLVSGDDECMLNHSGMMFPRKPGSYYHVSKVASGAAVDFATRAWGLHATVLYQGVVAGVLHPESSSAAGDVLTNTRFDVDECFGTVFNRFCAQAVLGIPMTLYGGGLQRRGFISLHDTVRSIAAFCADAVPAPGVVRHCNQITEIRSMQELAEMVLEWYDGDAEIQTVPNPRVESQVHTYEVATDNFRSVYPGSDVSLCVEVKSVLRMLQANIVRLETLRDAITPKTQWKAGR